MPFYTDWMTLEDIAEVMEIGRESASSGIMEWSAGTYRRELNQNQQAHYIVLCREEERVQDQELDSVSFARAQNPIWKRLYAMLKSSNTSALPERQRSLAGYGGLWLVVDEAHITTLAVRPSLRNQGFGELLLVALIEVALDIDAKRLTLEVRVSNEVAQALYRKYGFKPTGVRPRYYTDNQEDALIMWTEELESKNFQERFTLRREQLCQRLHTRGVLYTPCADRLAPNKRV